MAGRVEAGGSVGVVVLATDTRAVGEAAAEVGPALFFSLLIITLSFIPVFTLEAQEGRLFKPLAYAVTFSMIGSMAMEAWVSHQGAVRLMCSARANALKAASIIGIINARIARA